MVLNQNTKPKQPKPIVIQESKTLANFEPKPNKTSCPNVKSSTYIPVVQTELDYWHDDPNILARTILPDTYNFIPQTLTKTLEYYKLILSDSKSLVLKPHDTEMKDKYGNPTGKYINTHSSAQILKVIKPSKWGTNLSKPKPFTTSFNPPRYTYWDYKAVWFYTFTFQNELNQHSYLFYFLKTNKYDFPTWWKALGPNLDILPPDIKKNYKLFEQRFEPPNNYIPNSLHFFSIFLVAWVYQ